jgi:hypothetical protein
LFSVMSAGVVRRAIGQASAAEAELDQPSCCGLAGWRGIGVNDCVGPHRHAAAMR